jgi:hypothetical protein
MARLEELIGTASNIWQAGTGRADLEISGVTADSRQVRAGYLFAALPGSRADGSQFVADAVKRGAVAVLAPAETVLGDLPANVAVLRDNNARRRLALLSAAFYARQPKTIAAITGTSGKTSTADFTRQLWTRLGYRAASLGTLGVVLPDRHIDGALTTPDPVALHKQLAELADDGIDHLAMEASSHGLDQFRLDGVRVQVAAATDHQTERRQQIESLERARDREGDIKVAAESGDRQVLPVGAGMGADDAEIAGLLPKGNNFQFAAAAQLGQRREFRRIGVQHRKPAVAQDVGEKPALGGEIGVERAVIIQVIAAEIGEGGGLHPDAVEAELVEAVAGGLHRQMIDARIG